MARTHSNQTTGDDNAQWLALGQAAQLLGVKADTLRRWANAGHIPIYRTPGAHRRFAREDLLMLQVREQPNLPQNLEDLTVQRLRRRLRSPRRPQVSYGSFDDQARGHLRVLGRRLVELALRYHKERRQRPALREEARYIGHGYAGEALRLGLSLLQTVDSFIYHRTALTDTIRTLVPPVRSPDKAMGLWRDVSELVDIALVSIIEMYDSAGITRNDNMIEIHPKRSS